MVDQTIFKDELNVALKVLQDFIEDPENFQRIQEAVILMCDSLKNGGKILSCGNGGSHCDAMHFAEELTGRYRKNRKPFAAIAISDASYLSCVGNDFGYENVFGRFVEGVGNPKDILLAISTSGKSESIVNAVDAARRRKMKVIVLTGGDGGKLKGKGDVEICVTHFGYGDRIQEIHIKIIHSFILGIENQLIEE